MIRKVVPLAVAVAIAAVLLGPARQFLPSMSSGGDATAAGHGSIVDEQRPSMVGLAPAPILSPAASAARITLAAEALAKTEHGYLLTATAIGPDGRPLADAAVRFFELVELFGQREMLLGTGTTDGRGIAALAYLPAQTGRHQMVARTGSLGRVTAGEGRVAFQATVAKAQAATQPSAFAAFSDRVPYAAGVIVLAVWGLIGYALFGTARGVIGDAREPRRKGGHA